MLTASLGVVMTEFTYTHISPIFSLFFAALIAALFFNLINIKNLKHMYSGCWREKKLYIAIMLTIALMWFCSILAPGLIGASLYTFIYFAWLGTLGFFSFYLIDKIKSRIKCYFGIATLLLIIAAIFDKIIINDSLQVLLGIVLSIIGGTTMFVYFKQSQAIMRRAQLSATQILAVRFYLTVSLAFSFIPRGSFALHFTPIKLFEIAILATLNLIIPLFFQQKALEKITAEQNAIFVSLTPAFTGLIQWLIFREVTLHQFIFYMSYACVIIGSYFAPRYNNISLNKRLET